MITSKLLFEYIIFKNNNLKNHCQRLYYLKYVQHYQS